MTDDEERADDERKIARYLAGVGMFYDFDGEPIGALDFERLFMDPRRIVDRTDIGPRSVSTVWTGMDPMSLAFRQMHPDVDLPPLIYETMVFPDHEITNRYPTREAAQRGHDEAVTLLRATEDTQPPPEEES